MTSSRAAVLVVLLLFCACSRSGAMERKGDNEDKPGNVIALNTGALEKAEDVADKVRRKARHSEKAEGKQDLIKDKVDVKVTPAGEPVIEQTGEASRYSRIFQGKKTAGGERFDQKKLTAAHPVLPLGTKAKVTNLENGKSVNVRINDRGPYVKGRDIDLSPSAAKKLDMTKKGIAPVQIEARLPPTQASGDGENPSASEKPRAGK